MRRGGIDCMICMYGAPYPECCMKDCGTMDRCDSCNWPYRADKREEKENQNGKEKKMD